jgi:hypothetical protein
MATRNLTFDDFESTIVDNHAGQSATGLRHNAFSASNDAVQIV